MHAETKHDEQDQTLRQIFHQHNTSVKVQRHSSSSSTFALRPAPAAKSKAIFFFSILTMPEKANKLKNSIAGFAFEEPNFTILLYDIVQPVPYMKERQQLC